MLTWTFELPHGPWLVVRGTVLPRVGDLVDLTVIPAPAATAGKSMRYRVAEVCHEAKTVDGSDRVIVQIVVVRLAAPGDL